jgi:hypothetical protein
MFLIGVTIVCKANAPLTRITLLTHNLTSKLFLTKTTVFISHQTLSTTTIGTVCQIFWDHLSDGQSDLLVKIVMGSVIYCSFMWPRTSTIIRRLTSNLSLQIDLAWANWILRGSIIQNPFCQIQLSNNYICTYMGRTLCNLDNCIKGIYTIYAIVF